MPTPRFAKRRLLFAPKLVSQFYQLTSFGDFGWLKLNSQPERVFFVFPSRSRGWQLAGKLPQIRGEALKRRRIRRR
ncbi:hypothetical protein QPK87_10740 [Kamptonema cortianum]|nr:hypothetical protein [Kamptonema cortianum]